MGDQTCMICGSNQGVLDQVHLRHKDYVLCNWCAGRVMQYVDGNIVHHVINIFWGYGRVGYYEWEIIRPFLYKNNITEVLEFGTGLSSEVFVLLGMKLVSLDVLPYHSKMYQNHVPTNKAQFIHYEYGTLPDFEKLFPGKKWDFVFVDGPQERSREVKKAMELSSKFIYLHDPNLGEQNFFPNDEWEAINAGARIFQKVGT